MFQRYRKFWIALGGAFATGALIWRGQEWGLPANWPETVTAFLTAVLVERVRNAQAPAEDAASRAGA